jgi:hypothetical protein
LGSRVLNTIRGEFGDALDEMTEALLELARSRPPSELAKEAYALYERSQPEIPPGKRGWGASGKLDLDLIRKMTRSKE